MRFVKSIIADRDWTDFAFRAETCEQVTVRDASNAKRTVILFASRTLLHSQLSKNSRCLSRWYDFKKACSHYIWLRLFEAERKAIERDARGKRASKIPIRLVRLLLKDSRLALARAELKVSNPVFRTNIENLKVRFALCFQAYQAHRRHQATFNS